MKPNDIALIYHSGKKPAIVGRGTIVSAPYPEPVDGVSKEWTQVDVQFLDKLTQSIALDQLKNEPRLAQLKLFRQSRLSVVPLTQEEYKILIAL